MFPLFQTIWVWWNVKLLKLAVLHKAGNDFEYLNCGNLIFLAKAITLLLLPEPTRFRWTPKFSTIVAIRESGLASQTFMPSENFPLRTGSNPAKTLYISLLQPGETNEFYLKGLVSLSTIAILVDPELVNEQGHCIQSCFTVLYQHHDISKSIWPSKFFFWQSLTSTHASCLLGLWWYTTGSQRELNASPMPVKVCPFAVTWEFC